MGKREQQTDAVITKVHLVERAEPARQRHRKNVEVLAGVNQSLFGRYSVAASYFPSVSLCLALAADMSNLDDGIWPLTSNDLIKDRMQLFFTICHIRLRTSRDEIFGLNVISGVVEQGGGACAHILVQCNQRQVGRYPAPLQASIIRVAVLHLRYHLRTAIQKFKISSSQGRQNVAKKESDISSKPRPYVNIHAYCSQSITRR